MSLAAAAAAAAAALVELAKGAGKGVTASATIASCPATAHSAGVDGIALVRNWPGGWKVSEHAKNVRECVRKGYIASWRWVPVPVDPRLTVFCASDALAIGDNPRARIPINQSGCQRLLDWLGAQMGRKLLMPTPKISDARHLACVRGAGRVIEQVSPHNPGTVPEPVPMGNRGQDVSQWLRQQERLRKAIDVAGGYPATGLVSTLGKDVVLSPQTVQRARPDDAAGEVGSKMLIYGWHLKAAPSVVPPGVRNLGPYPPQLPALAAAGWRSVRQQESGAHADLDNGPDGAGGFWDYSSIVVPVLDDCVLDGQLAKLSSVYVAAPELVYAFGGAPPKAIAARYPLVSPSVA